MKKAVGITSFLIFLMFCYFFQKDFRDNEVKAVSIAPAAVIQTPKNIEPSDDFVERRSTFTYRGQRIQYLLIFPAQYTQMTNQWPLILFLHGSSLRGQNLDLVKEYGPTWFSERRSDFPFVVLAPQCAEHDDWINKSDLLVALLDEIFKKYRIDQDKVYLTGVSLGGSGTWFLACQHPEYFAAIAPIAAASPIIPTTWNSQMISMPIWAFHGAEDSIAPLKKDAAMIHALRNQGSMPRFTILPDQGHNIAGIYKNKELYDWFLSNTRQH